MQRRNDTLQRGQAVVELALLLPAILLVTLAVLDFGRALYTYIAISGAVRDAARYGSIHYSSPPSSGTISNRVTAVAGNAVTGSLNITVQEYKCDSSYTSCSAVSYSNSSGDKLLVSASYNYVLLTGLLNNTSIPMSATAVMTID